MNNKISKSGEKGTAKEKKVFTVNGLEGLQKEFYQMYNPDYWLYRIMLFKNSHDDFDLLKPSLTKGIGEVVDEDFRRVMRTEMHFLYFQMIETLFEIIFAISEQDGRNLWLALTFSNFRNNYEMVADLNSNSDIFTEKITVEIDGMKMEIPVLRWILYFVYPSKLSDEEWIKNLENIKRLLLSFAQDFSDRGEYNAYKHSLRFYNAPFSMAIGLAGSEQMHSLGSFKDCITFLEEQKKKDLDGKLRPTGRIMRTQKPFDFNKDFERCIVIYEMIKNVIYTRKYSILSDLRGQEFTMTNFVNLDSYKNIFAVSGTKKSSFTV